MATDSMFSYLARIWVLVVLVGVDGAGGGNVRAEVGGEIQLNCTGEGRGGCRFGSSLFSDCFLKLYFLSRTKKKDSVNCRWEQQGHDGMVCCYGDNCQVAEFC